MLRRMGSVQSVEEVILFVFFEICFDFAVL
jgi:hypothetical protein